MSHVGSTTEGHANEAINPKRQILNRCARPVVAEGPIHSPAQAAAADAAGAEVVRVGTAITHPSTITSWFVAALNKEN